MSRIVKSKEFLDSRGSMAIVSRNVLGQFHCQDGPAVEHRDGRNEWYINGQLHREDGPAVELSNGQKEWYKNGVLHREGGPAIEYASGVQDWYFEGELYAKVDNDRKQQWWKKGSQCSILHREDGPAMTKYDGTELWMIENQLHRTDGPAVIYPDGEVEYWVEGKEFPKEDFEAKYMPKPVEKKDELVGADGSKTRIEITSRGRKAYILDGVYHREDGPAVEYPDGTKEWWYYGVLVRQMHPIDNRRSSSIMYSSEYRDDDGNIHREGGPSRLGLSEYYFEYQDHGTIHRTDGPARAGWDGQLEWFLNGKRHRLDGPALICSDGDQHWLKEGQRHRVDGPAIDRVDGHKEWWVEGVRHRLDGPAIEYSNGEKNWYIHGQKMIEEQFNEEREKQLAYQQFEEIKSHLILNSDGQWKLTLQTEAASADQPPIKEVLNDQGLRHCEDGPAVIYADGRQEWWLNGEKVEQNTSIWKDILKASIAVTFSACMELLSAPPEVQEVECEDCTMETFEQTEKTAQCVDV